MVGPQGARRKARGGASPSSSSSPGSCGGAGASCSWVGSSGNAPECWDAGSATANGEKHLYAVLGLRALTPSPDAIRMAYRRLARMFHPDRHQGSERAKQKFQAIQGAYEVLSDRIRRQQYDLWLLEYLDVVDYLNAFTGFTLTVCGLGMGSKRLHEGSGSGIILAGDTHGTGACAGGCDDHHLLYHTCGTASTRTASTTTNNHNHSTFSTNTTVNHGATMVDSASSGGACPSVGRAH